MASFQFVDMLQPGDPIRVLAHVSVVGAEDGGRSAPFTCPYRPNHNFGSADNRVFYIGQLEIPVGMWIYPGETHELEITFLNGDGLADLLQIGRTWRIQEGPRHVASAQVLAMVSGP